MYLKKHPKPGMLDYFDKDCINILNDILKSDNEILKYLNI